MSKVKEKSRAIKLRKMGLTYNEILSKIPVVKSTLSLWLRSVDLSKPQKQIISQKRRLAQAKGAQAQKNKRVLLQENIYRQAEKEIGRISQRELWLIGTALYWAEGSKEKEYNPGSGAISSNSDPKMINLFIKWLFICCGVSHSEIKFEIYIHVIYKHRLTDIKQFWSKSTNFSFDKFNTVYFKNHNIKTRRANSGNLYYGVLRVKVRASSSLNRCITGWIRGIIKNWGIV